MSLYRLDDPGDLVAPTVVAAFDGWVDAGPRPRPRPSTWPRAATSWPPSTTTSSSTTARGDRRSRSSTGASPSSPGPSCRCVATPARRAGPPRPHRPRAGLPLARARPSRRRAGRAPRASPSGSASGRSRPPCRTPAPCPIMGTESRAGPAPGRRPPGPEGLLRVPAAALSVLDMAVAEAGIPAVGYFAQVPHYVTRAVPGRRDRAAPGGAGATSATTCPATDAGARSPSSSGRGSTLATGADETTRAYVERLEAMVDEAAPPVRRRAHLRDRAVPPRSRRPRRPGHAAELSRSDMGRRAPAGRSRGATDGCPPTIARGPARRRDRPATRARDYAWARRALAIERIVSSRTIRTTCIPMTTRLTSSAGIQRTESPLDDIDAGRAGGHPEPDPAACRRLRLGTSPHRGRSVSGPRHRPRRP